MVELGGYVDLIISNYSFHGETESAYDLKIWLSNKSDSSYLNKSLRLSRIPFVLIHTDSSSSETDYLLGFDRVVRLSEIDRDFKRINHVTVSTVKSWLDDLLDDYDLLDADPIVPFLRVPLFWKYGCKILTKDYVKRPARLPFLTFQRDIDRAEKAIEDFYNQIERISRSSKPSQEKRYHDTLSKHPEFLTGDVYDKDTLMHEQNFILPSNDIKGYEQPDFMMVHKFHKFNKISNLVEVKLPQEKFIVKKRVQPISGNLRDSFTQVLDYKDYFNNPENDEEIVKVFGFKPIVRHSLLFGRSSERDIHLEVIHKRIRQFQLNDIDLITYDDLITRREKLLKYQKLYHVS